ncbi:MAG: CARDB domain-containing protein [Pseudomonadota bacterium]
MSTKKAALYCCFCFLVSVPAITGLVRTASASIYDVRIVNTYAGGPLVASSPVNIYVDITNSDPDYAYDCYLAYYLDGAYQGTSDIFTVYDSAQFAVTATLSAGSHTVQFHLYVYDGSWQYSGYGSFGGYWTGSPEVAIRSVDGVSTTSALEECTVEFTVENYGNADAKNLPIMIYTDGAYAGSVTYPNIPAGWYGQSGITFPGGFEAGSHTIRFAANISDSDSSDNSAQGTFTWTGAPDIAIRSVDGVSTTSALEDCDVDFTIENYGNADAVNLPVMIHVDGAYAGSVTYPNIPAGAYGQLGITFPGGFEAGSHTIRFTANISDSDSSDNSAQNTFTWTGAPDIAIHSVDSISTADALEDCTVDYTIENYGNADALNLPVIVYVDGTYAGRVIYPNIPAGAYGQLEITFPGGFEAGSHTIRFTANISDSDSSDNSAQNTFTWTGAPEIAIHSVDGVSTTSALEDCTVDYTIENYGNADALNLAVMVYVDGAYVGSVTYPNIPAESYGQLGIVFAGGFEAGSHTIRFTANISDSNSSDNSAQNTFTWTGAPDIAIHSVDGVSTADALEDCTVEFTIENYGNADALNLPVVVYVDGAYAGAVTYPSISAGAHGQLGVVFPGGFEAGAHTIRFTANITDSDSSDNSAQNTFTWAGAPDVAILSVDGVSTTSALEDCIVEFTIENYGNADAVSLPVMVYVDDTYAGDVTYPNIPAKGHGQLGIIFPGGFGAGSHTLRFTANISDSNSADNSAENTFTWTGAPEIVTQYRQHLD